ncbi:hypothetical protein [Thalassobius sp. MITS945101]|uniref:hypothetical protein n=1 Tax=Thalassobius sp. MITS945101 TaxID=3096994 RepID=UPI0039996B57
MTLQSQSFTPCQQRVETCGYDSFELGLLPVLRHLLTSFHSPESHAWFRAQTVSVERWGENVGLAVCFRLQALVRMLMEARGPTLLFIDPLDVEQRCFISADEETLLWMLHYMRRDRTPKARDAVEKLTRGQMDPHLIREGLKFAARFPAAGTGAAKPYSGPRLSVVR